MVVQVYPTRVNLMILKLNELILQNLALLISIFRLIKNMAFLKRSCAKGGGLAHPVFLKKRRFFWSLSQQIQLARSMLVMVVMQLLVIHWRVCSESLVMRFLQNTISMMRDDRLISFVQA